MIDSALNAAILTGINTLQAAGLTTQPMTRESLLGSLMAANATVRAFGEDKIKAELRHIIKDQPVLSGVRTRRGYLQADLNALS